ncbi:MAG: hypothetical protein R2716_01405 [Microthrixaceae bacterium]
MDLESTRHVEELLDRMDDHDLSEVAQMVRDLQRERALLAEDLEAVVADGFERGFDHRGMALDPWITPGGLVVCPGAKIHRSRANHRCRFAAVGDTWVWESPERVVDELRRLPDDRDSIQTVTVLAAVDGLVLEVVTSKASGGRHNRQSSIAFEVRSGELVPAMPTASPSGDERR